MPDSTNRSRSGSFTVPAGAGNYAPEILYLGLPGGALAADIPTLDPVGDFRLNVTTLIAASTIEVDQLKPGGNPATAGDWRLAVASQTLAGLSELLTGCGGRFRVRVKSGGVGGTGVVDANWQRA